MTGAGRTLLWSADELVAVLGGRTDGTPAGGITGVSMDSRTVGPGEAFFAIRGERLDGHDFVADALSRGAAVAVVEEGFDRGGAQGALVRVDDTLEAMRRLGAAARARSPARIIAVTGSVGKTGTKRALGLALEPSGAVHASPASFNNQWGVPFTLANLPASAAFAVFEIGMNHAGEIAPLAALVRPHIAIITTIEPVHIGHLGSIEAIADAKAEIFEGLEPDGTAVLNRDNGQFERVAAAARARAARIIGFGEDERADARLLRVVARENGSVVDADIMGTNVTYKIGAPGRHLVMNSLAVLAAVSAAGGDLALGALALAGWTSAPGRGARVALSLDGGEAVLIDESYNANPASMRAALSLLGATAPGRRGRRIAVLGDMLELGDHAPVCHRELAGPIEAAHVDLVHACGPHMRDLWEALPKAVRGHYGATSGELEEAVVNGLRPGDVVMVKGSLGSGMRPLVDALVRRFGGPAGKD